MTWFSKKMLISTRCICGFMPKLHKKSWMVSNPYVTSAYFWTFLPTHYVSINTLLNVSKTDNFLDLPNQSFADVVYGRPLSFGSHIWCAHYRAFIVERTLFPSNYASCKLIWWQSKTAQCSALALFTEITIRW